jgi:hypothetical protein
MSRPSRSLAPLLAAAGLAALGAVPAAAEQQPAQPPNLSEPAPVAGPPTAVVLRITGGFSPHDRWIWYDGDGTARLRGMLLEDLRSRFKSHVDFKQVRTVLDDAHACAPHAGVSRPIIGNDVLYYRVDVRCGATWRVMRDWVRPAAEETQTPDMWKIVHGLEALAGELTWSPSDDDVALPNPLPLFRFAAPAS